jgi:DNA ligase D-like protein (predicted 3'-phosphoesterase)
MLAGLLDSAGLLYLHCASMDLQHPPGQVKAMNDKLEAYRSKRNFRKTGEPMGGRHRKGGRRFVIQKHDASSLHYDFRLEFGGVLVSWAVPKGLSTDTRERRLAIQTEDHPLDYIDFEGVIPEGEYGGGTVLVWDTGFYRNLRANKGRDSRSMERSLEDGLIEVWLDGEKLAGGYALKRIEDGDKPRWLVIKMDDEHADARRRPVSTEPDSVKTGRDLDTIARENTDEHG